MNCIYCQQNMGEPIVTEPEKLYKFHCDNCRVIFRVTNKDGQEIFSIGWQKIEITDKGRYYVKIYPGLTGNAPSLIVYYLPAEPFTAEWQTVMRFDFIPDDWTPSNAAHKIKTYLPFL